MKNIVSNTPITTNTPIKTNTPATKPIISNKLVRPKDCNIFNSDTIIRHKTSIFEEFAIYLLKDKLLYRCDVDGNISSKGDSFKTFNSFTVSNDLEYFSGKKSKNAYKKLEYFDKSLNKFISMKNVRDNEFLN